MMPLLQGPFSFRLGLTVLHALWELALVALVVWVGLALLRRRSAQTRYTLACVGLALMLALPLITWWQLGYFEAAAHAPVNEVEAQLLVAPVTGATAFFPGLLLRVLRLAPWAAMLWFAGVMVMFARLGAGLWWLDHSYRRQARPVAAPLQESLDRLAARMGLGRGVRLLESARAESPLLLGWLKPVILVPSAALLQLSPAALEAILAHELAHVRRGDYLMNLLQSIAEALLFFHPCAWWLSRTIRELREHCCDDAAASLCGDPLILAEGLSALERLRRRIQPDPEPALAAAKGKLMSRISRLFQPQVVPVSSARGVAWTLVGASLLGAAALTAQQATPKKKAALLQAPSPKAPDKVEYFDFSQIKITHQPPAPAYPAEAKAQRIQGTVVVEVTVDETGTPIEAKALKGPEALRSAALAYAQSWRFEAAKKNGKAVKARFKLTMPFRLRGEDPAPKISQGKVDATPGEAQDTDFSMIKIELQPPAPAYPAEAKAQRIQGTVVVEITVDEHGVPVGVKALSGPEELRPTALGYAEQWRFRPHNVNGKPTKARFKLTMPFRLR